MKKVTLKLLRELSREANRNSALMAKEAGQTGELESWDSSRICLGEAFAYDRLIKHVKDLSEREYQVQKKKGTL